MATTAEPADLAVQAVVVDEEDRPELPGQHAREEAASWEEKAGFVLQEESHGEGCNPVRSRFCWSAGGGVKGRVGEAQVEEDEEGGQGLHVRLKAAHLDSKIEGSRLKDAHPDSKTED